MEIESLLSSLMQIHSVNPLGGETEVAMYLKPYHPYSTKSDLLTTVTI